MCREKVLEITHYFIYGVNLKKKKRNIQYVRIQPAVRSLS